ncbi:uncharacterized protein LOC115966629 [Quercus lobata]|uniref:uncharacterized protein LOC115966629 n=1 Tax=Quercus lobata TaxID=97700 RepID=UPI0012441DF5|nr:uncharacterized protein LOC115966629 [Quercus lobata]
MGFMALKLDMSKAYDRVEWDFLDKIMERLGFDEGLHSLIQQAADNGELRGVSLCKEGPKITHLFFVDDSLLFCRANDTDCQTVMNILTMYEEASGLKINREKTQLFFSTNTQENIKNRVKDLVGVEVVTQYEKYLGMPSFVGRAKKETFKYIRESVWHKIQGWKEKLLSQAGWEILIKAIIQAMPTFTMGCFKLPKNLCKDIEALTRKFWWGYSGEAGVGVVVRDADGRVCGALSDRTVLPATVEEVEAIACRKVVRFAIQLGLANVVFGGF